MRNYNHQLKILLFLKYTYIGNCPYIINVITNSYGLVKETTHLTEYQIINNYNNLNIFDPRDMILYQRKITLRHIIYFIHLYKHKDLYSKIKVNMHI